MHNISKVKMKLSYNLTHYLHICMYHSKLNIYISDICDAGQEETSFEMCEPCAIGFYKSSATPGAKCEQCQPDFVTAKVGAMDRSDCNIRKYEGTTCSFTYSLCKHDCPTCSFY